MRSLAVLALAAAPVLALDEEIGADYEAPAGEHRIERPLRVVADGVTLDLRNATLVGAAEGTPRDRFAGIGVVVAGRRNVTILGGTLRGFRCAILVQDSEGVVIDGVDVSGNFARRLESTPEREAVADWLRPHDNDKQEWRQRYGAGICLEACRGAIVRGCRARRQQNGLILDRASGCRVYDNDFSFLSGWGIALWRATGNVVCRNSFDWCVRGYSHGVYDRGQDSAGILVFEQSSNNVFYKNSATHGGDGFFLYAGEETLRRTGKGGCNDNVVMNNDFSHAVANAIEATFSGGNKFLGNRCDDSNYGVWAGYSYDTTIEGNTFESNSIAGVAIEHGENNRIHWNTFSGNRRGIWLWWDDDKDLLKTVFAKERSCRSRGYHIARNTFRGGAAIVLRDTADVNLEANDFSDVKERVVREGKVERVRESAASDVVWGEIPKGDADFPGERHAFLAADHPRGRSHIRVDEWGPLDPTETAVFPRRVVAWGRCRFFVLGPDPKFEVRGLPAGLVAKPERGAFTVAGPAGLTSFSCTVHLGERIFPVEGVVLNATWRVAHFEWTEDPRTEGAWERLMATEPKQAGEADTVDFRWGGRGPTRADRFATRATTRIRLPAGRYELRTVSDDGVRVLVDGKVVIEDWTWHAPREASTAIDLEAGEHAFEIHHFELDGYAVLRFDLRPAR